MTSFTPTNYEDRSTFNIPRKPRNSTSASGAISLTTNSNVSSAGTGPSNESSGESRTNEFVTVSKTTLLQLIDALSTSARLLQENIDPAGIDATADDKPQQSDSKPSGIPTVQYKEVETHDKEKIARNHATVTQLALLGRNGELVSHYLHVYDRLPFQTLPSPNEDGTLPPARIKLEALDNCCQLQIELWELLLEYRYSAWDMVFFKKRIIDSSKDVNKTEFLLLVDVITEKLGRQAFSYESEGEHEQALRTLVSICGTGHIYNKDLATCDVYDGMGAAVDAGPKPHHLARCSIWSEMRIGTVLSGLYAEGLLQKPADADLVSLRLNAARVIQALFPLRFFISEIDWKEHFHSRDICPEASHPVEILNLKMSDLIRVAAKEHKSDWPRATGLSFSIRLMNVDELRNIGNINIEWTSNLYEHLELSFSGFATLKIYWFAWSTLELPIARMGTFAQNSREELLSTYHLLFGVPSRDSFMSQSKNALHKYNGITTHPSIFPHYPKIREHKRMGKLATKDGRPYNFGAEYHLSVEETHISNMSKTDHQQDRYENFPVFEDKLRILVAYMDTQKPGGLRGLWHDKRDSGAWFTFWAVVWIGGVSLIIGLLSLGATVTQTVVAFKALQPEPSVTS